MGQTDKECAKIIRGFVYWLGDFSPVILPEDREPVIKTTWPFKEAVWKRFS